MPVGHLEGVANELLRFPAWMGIVPTVLESHHARQSASLSRTKRINGEVKQPPSHRQAGRPT